jgi:hypothetical protein
MWSMAGVVVIHADLGRCALALEVDAEPPVREEEVVRPKAVKDVQ